MGPVNITSPAVRQQNRIDNNNDDVKGLQALLEKKERSDLQVSWQFAGDGKTEEWSLKDEDGKELATYSSSEDLEFHINRGYRTPFVIA